MSIIDTLIFDRSPADTEALETLLTKAKAGTLTNAEKAALVSPSHKGAYNYTDLNRVNSAMAYLAQELEQRGYIVSGYQADSTTWSQQSIPTKTQLNRYLSNVTALRKAVALMSGTPSVPKDMEALTASEANNIERILVNCDQVIRSMSQVYPAAAQPLVYAGFVIYVDQFREFFVYTAEGLQVYTTDEKAVQAIG